LDKEISFRNMRDTLSFMLITAINSKWLQIEKYEESERLYSIKNICGELSELWGIGYGVLPKEREELLEQILKMVDSLIENEGELA